SNSRNSPLTPPPWPMLPATISRAAMPWTFIWPSSPTYAMRSAGRSGKEFARAILLDRRHLDPAADYCAGHYPGCYGIFAHFQFRALDSALGVVWLARPGAGL